MTDTVTVVFKWAKATIVTPTTTYRKYRFRVDGQRAIVADRHGTDQVTLDVASVTTEGATARIVGTDGQVWWATTLGCGCGVSAAQFPTAPVDIPT